MTLGQNIAAKALSHVGEHEYPMGSNSGPEVDEYLAYVGLPPGNPWCAAFACAVVYRTLIGMGIYTNYHPKTGSTHELLEWGEDNGTVVSTPEPGDFGCMIFSPLHGHTVICVGVPPNENVATVEGNHGDAVVNNVRRIKSCRWIRPYKVIPSP